MVPAAEVRMAKLVAEEETAEMRLRHRNGENGENGARGGE